MPLKVKYFIDNEIYQRYILRNKNRGIIATDKDDLEDRVRDILIKYLGKTEYETNTKVREIIEKLSRDYRDIESLIRDSEFVMRSRAILKYYPHGDIYEEPKVIRTHNEATCYPIATLAYLLTYTYYLPQTNPYMSVGSDTSVLTYCTMGNLASPYSQGASSSSWYWATGVLGSSPGSGGQVYMVITSTWNAGVLPSGTIGEVGAFQNLINSIQGNQNYGSSAPDNGYVLYARVSSASGAFSPISYTNTAPFTATLTLYLAV